MAVFGMEVSCMGAPDEAHHSGSVCLGRGEPGTQAVPATFHTIHNGDLVFIKSYTPQTGLDMKAVGVVLSNVPTDAAGAMCIPVRWIWQGDRHLSDPEDHWPLRGDPLYEEHDLLVQRQILDLLPVGLALRQP